MTTTPEIEPLTADELDELHKRLIENRIWMGGFSNVDRPISRLIAQARRALEVGAGWQLIETAPKDGTRIHLGFAHMANFDVIGHWQDDHWAHGSLPQDRFYGRPEPTHWQPLPAPPGAKPVCGTCNGHGMIGGYQRFGDGEVDSICDPCPDCSPPSPASAESDEVGEGAKPDDWLRGFEGGYRQAIDVARIIIGEALEDGKSLQQAMNELTDLKAAPPSPNPAEIAVLAAFFDSIEQNSASNVWWVNADDPEVVVCNALDAFDRLRAAIASAESGNGE